jgi:hypothetical protein
MIKMAMVEKFSKYSWMSEWKKGETFNNTFLVRKPGLQTPFIRMSSGSEVALSEDNAEQLTLMRKVFLEDDEPLHRPPAEAWDAMLNLNDGGMNRMALPEQGRTPGEQAGTHRRAARREPSRTGAGRPGNWYQPDGDEEVAKKARIAQEIVAAVKKRNGMHGEPLARLVPTRRSLHALYMQQVSLPDAVEEEDVFDIGLDDTSSVKSHSHEVAFAHQSVQHWINHLRGLPETPAMLSYIGLPRATAEELVDELITGLLRLRAEEALVSVMENTDQAGVPRLDGGSPGVARSARDERFYDLAWLSKRAGEEAPYPPESTRSTHLHPSGPVRQRGVER